MQEAVQPSATASSILVRTLTPRDHALVVPMWQQGFLEMWPHIQARLCRSWLIHGIVGSLVAAGLLTRSKVCFGLSLAFGAFIHSAASGWILRKLLWQGVLRETARDMAEPRIYEKYLSPGHSTFLVAENERGEILGCVAVLCLHTLHKEARAGVPPMPGEASIWRLSVQPSARRLGVGRRLMAEAEAWARANGCRHISLVTGNADSQRFYTRLGYGPETVERARRVLFGERSPWSYGPVAWLKAAMLHSRLSPGSHTVFMKPLL